LEKICLEGKVLNHDFLNFRENSHLQNSVISRLAYANKRTSDASKVDMLTDLTRLRGTCTAHSSRAAYFRYQF